jgi:putative membrane protein
LWQTPRAFKAFGTNKESARTSQQLATNQGVYNLFLAAGLIASLLFTDPISFAFKVFFLSCIVIAALTAGLTVSKRIMLIQGTPALLALALVVLARQ